MPRPLRTLLDHARTHEATGDFSNLSVGAFAHLGKEVFLDLTDRLVIEDAVSVGMRAILLTHFNVGVALARAPWLWQSATVRGRMHHVAVAAHDDRDAILPARLGPRPSIAHECPIARTWPAA